MKLKEKLAETYSPVTVDELNSLSGMQPRASVFYDAKYNAYLAGFEAAKAEVKRLLDDVGDLGDGGYVEDAVRHLGEEEV